MEGTKISFQPTYSCQTTQTKVMMPKKSPVSHTVPTWSIPNLLNTKKEEDLTESTGVVPAKNPLKVKSEESSNNAREYELQRNCACLFFLGSLGFYSHIGPDSFVFGTSLFLTGEILINACIFQNSTRVGTLQTKANHMLQVFFI